MFKPDRSAKATAGFPRKFSPDIRGRSHTVVLAALVVATGAGLGALWYTRQKSAPPPEPRVEQPAGYSLSDGTKAVLRQLAVPVEIKFYSLLDPATAPEAVTKLAARAGELLAACEQAAGGRLTVRRMTAMAKESTAAALKDGLKPLELSPGDPGFLGFAVAGRDKKEILPLLPEWEPAMESDLARALARVSTAPVPVFKPVAADPQAAARTLARINALIPDVKATPLAEGIQRLRDAALDEFKTAATDLKQQVEAAQQHLSEVQNGPSEADKQAARQKLQQVQSEQGRKLKEIAAQLQDEIEKFQQLKQATEIP